MSLIVVLAVVALAVLAIVAIFAARRSREAGRATGSLTRETRSRDRKARKEQAQVVAAVTTGRDVERAAVLERKGGALVPVAESAPPQPWVPPDPEQIGVSRRQFLNRSIVSFFALGLAGFGAGVLGFLWPSSKGGFGAKIRVGTITDITAQITQGQGFYYYPDGRMWITEYPSSALDKARKVYSAAELSGMEAGVVALYQKCVHLGCRVPACLTSQWFECPCHGSQYSRVGEKKGGPAPRGLDRFAMTVDGGALNVNTGQIILGPPIGTNTTGQEAEGPHCISGGSEHK